MTDKNLKPKSDIYESFEKTSFPSYFQVKNMENNYAIINMKGKIILNFVSEKYDFLRFDTVKNDIFIVFNNNHSIFSYRTEYLFNTTTEKKVFFDHIIQPKSIDKFNANGVSIVANANKDNYALYNHHGRQLSDKSEHFFTKRKNLFIGEKSIYNEKGISVFGQSERDKISDVTSIEKITFLKNKNNYFYIKGIVNKDSIVYQGLIGVDNTGKKTDYIPLGVYNTISVAALEVNLDKPYILFMGTKEKNHSLYVEHLLFDGGQIKIIQQTKALRHSGKIQSLLSVGITRGNKTSYKFYKLQSDVIGGHYYSILLNTNLELVTPHFYNEGIADTLDYNGFIRCCDNKDCVLIDTSGIIKIGPNCYLEGIPTNDYIIKESCWREPKKVINKNKEDISATYDDIQYIGGTFCKIKNKNKSGIIDLSKNGLEIIPPCFNDLGTIIQWDKKNKAFYFWFGTITKDDKEEKCCAEYNIKDPPAFTISATGTCITGDCATYKQLVQEYHAQNKK